MGGERRSQRGIADPIPWVRPFQDQLALSRFAPGKTVEAKTPCELRRCRRGGGVKVASHSKNSMGVRDNTVCRPLGAWRADRSHAASQARHAGPVPVPGARPAAPGAAARSQRSGGHYRRKRSILGTSNRAILGPGFPAASGSVASMRTAASREKPPASPLPHLGRCLGRQQAAPLEREASEQQKGCCRPNPERDASHKRSPGWVRRAVCAVTHLKHSREPYGADLKRGRPEGGVRDEAATAPLRATGSWQ